MSRLIKDPLIRRFISASFFAGAFVWVAVRYFNVEADVVWVFFGLSFVFVGLMMAVGLVVAPVIRLFRSEPPFLSGLSGLSDPDNESGLPGKEAPGNTSRTADSRSDTGADGTA